MFKESRPSASDLPPELAPVASDTVAVKIHKIKATWGLKLKVKTFGTVARLQREEESEIAGRVLTASLDGESEEVDSSIKHEKNDIDVIKILERIKKQLRSRLKLGAVENYSDYMFKRTVPLMIKVMEEKDAFGLDSETVDPKFMYKDALIDSLYSGTSEVEGETIKIAFIKEEFSKYLESKDEEEEMTLDKFVVLVITFEILFISKTNFDKQVKENSYVDGDDFVELDEEEKTTLKKKRFKFFRDDQKLLAADLVFDPEVNFFEIAFIKLLEKIEKKSFDEDKFITDYALILNISKSTVQENFNKLKGSYDQVKLAEKIIEEDHESVYELIDSLEDKEKEINEEEEKEKEKKKEEEKKSVDILSAISGVSGSSVEESSSAVGGEIIRQLDPPVYIQKFIKEGRVDDNGNYVCDLKDYDVRLVFTQDPDTKEYRLEIKDQKAKYASEIIKLNDKSGDKEWDRVEYNIDKLTSLAVVSDLGLTSFFNAGSELKMMQFVHLMVVPNLKSIANVEPDQWYKRANKKDTPLLKRSAAVAYIKKFFELDGESKITKGAWEEKLNNHGLLGKGGKMKPMHRLVVNKEFLEAKQKFAASFDGEEEEANRNTT